MKEMELTGIIMRGNDIIDVMQAANQMAATDFQARNFALKKMLGKFGTAASLYEAGDKLIDGNYGGAGVAVENLSQGDMA